MSNIATNPLQELKISIHKIPQRSSRTKTAESSACVSARLISTALHGYPDLGHRSVLFKSKLHRVDICYSFIPKDFNFLR